MNLLALFFSIILLFGSTAAGESVQQKRKVGFVLSLTGPWGHFGEAQRHALEMARADHPELFKNVKFIYEDCQYKSKDAVASFKKLRDFDVVDAVFVWGVEPSLALAPIAEASKTPLFVSALDPRAAIDRSYVVRTINLAAQHSSKLAHHLQALGFKNLAIVKAEISFFDVLVAGLKANLNTDQKMKIIDNYLPGQLDFRTTVAKLREGKYDALGVYLGPDQVAQFYRQLSTQRIEIPSFGATPFQSESVIRDAAGSMEGAFFAHNYVDEKFRARYIAQVGDDMQIPWAANAYDFAVLIGETLSSAKAELTGEEILARATGFKERKGVGGKYTFVHSPKMGKYFNYPIAVYQIVGNSYLLTTD